MNQVKMKLSRPIEAGDKKISEITINEPTAGQLMDVGLPFKDGAIDFKMAGKLLEAVTGVQLPFLKTMSGPDFVGAVTKMVGFLKVSEETLGD